MPIDLGEIICPYCKCEHVVTDINQIDNEEQVTMNCKECEKIFYVEASVTYGTLECVSARDE